MSYKFTQKVELFEVRSSLKALFINQPSYQEIIFEAILVAYGVRIRIPIWSIDGQFDITFSKHRR